MAGLNYGYGYRIKRTWIDDNKDKETNNEGVFYNAKSKKWIIRIENNTSSKYLRPYVSIAQFDNKEDAIKEFQALKQ